MKLYRDYQKCRPPQTFIGLHWQTCGSEEEEHSDPVNPEEHEREEGPKGLQGQQRQMSEHFTSHVKQSDGERHSLPHEEHQQQQNHLRCTVMQYYISAY